MLYSALGAGVELGRWGGRNLALAVAASTPRPFHPCIPVALNTTGMRTLPMLPPSRRTRATCPTPLTFTSGAPLRGGRSSTRARTPLVMLTANMEVLGRPRERAPSARVPCLGGLAAALPMLASARSPYDILDGRTPAASGHTAGRTLRTAAPGLGVCDRASPVALTTPRWTTLPPFPRLAMRGGGYGGRRPAPLHLGDCVAVDLIHLRLRALPRTRSARSTNSTGPRARGTAHPRARFLRRRRLQGQRVDAALRAVSE